MENEDKWKGVRERKNMDKQDACHIIYEVSI